VVPCVWHDERCREQSFYRPKKGVHSEALNATELFLLARPSMAQVIPNPAYEKKCSKRPGIRISSEELFQEIRDGSSSTMAAVEVLARKRH
jgi:hypothetical protein